MRPCERIDLGERGRDPRERRKWRSIDIEEFCAGRLTGEANVGQRDRVTVAVETGRFVSQIYFERSQRSQVPVLAPLCSRRFVDLEFVLEIFAHPWHDQGM